MTHSKGTKRRHNSVREPPPSDEPENHRNMAALMEVFATLGCIWGPVLSSQSTPDCAFLDRHHNHLNRKSALTFGSGDYGVLYLSRDICLVSVPPA